MCDRYHFGLVGCKIVKYISRYWQPCKSIAAAWRPDPANHASARDHAPLPRQPPLPPPEPPVGHVSPGHINMCGWGGKDGPVERRMERIFTKRRLDTRWRGCRDENEIRKRERGAPALLPAPLWNQPVAWTPQMLWKLLCNLDLWYLFLQPLDLRWN